jgi:hypothetical protein
MAEEAVWDLIDEVDRRSRRNAMWRWCVTHFLPSFVCGRNVAQSKSLLSEFESFLKKKKINITRI